MFKLHAFAKAKMFYVRTTGNSSPVQFFFATLDSKMCYYKILGLSNTASAADIKEAYISLVKKYHPDHNVEDPHAEESFKVLSKAYEILKDPTTRKNYDHTKTAGFGSSSYSSSSAYQNSSTYSSGFSNSQSQGEYNYYDDEAHRRAKDQKMRDEYYRMKNQEGSIFTSLALKMLLVVSLAVAYDWSTRKTEKKTRKRIDYIDTDRQAAPGTVQRGESAFGNTISNNPLAFVREKRMTPEALAEEMAKKQFRMEYSTVVTRQDPKSQHMRDKWSKENKKTIKDLDKFMVQKNIKMQKSHQI